MSRHPNAVLLLTLTPNEISNMSYDEAIIHSKNVYNDILEFTNTGEEDQVKINDKGYTILVMDDDYHEPYHISATLGDTVVFGYLSYGYGDVMKWCNVENMKNELETWGKSICEKFNCTYEINITANYR